jgi:hypothetical protein
MNSNADWVVGEIVVRGDCLRLGALGFGWKKERAGVAGAEAGSEGP